MPPSSADALRVLVVDDEPLARDCVRLALGKLPDVVVAGECAGGEEAVRAIAECRPDVVLLDVQMPGLDGFGVVERVGPDRMPPVVFVTAYDAHALRAFRVHALDYVLKPFDDARLAEVMAYVRARLTARRDEALGRQLGALLAERLAAREPDDDGGAAAHLRAPSGHVTRFCVSEGGRARFVPAAAVDWIDADGNYVRLHVGAEQHRLRATLRAVAAELDPRQFVQIHRSTIVNIDRIRELQPWFGGDYVALLTSGVRLRVSRSRAPTLLRPLR
jgi:two-component system LytT family response regulator